MQELRKFDSNISIIPNRLEKYMSFNINIKLIFIDSFQFLRKNLEILLKNLGEDDFKYFSQEFVDMVLDLIKPKRFYPYEYLIEV